MDRTGRFVVLCITCGVELEGYDLELSANLNARPGCKSQSGIHAGYVSDKHPRKKGNQ